MAPVWHGPHDPSNLVCLKHLYMTPFCLLTALRLLFRAGEER